ncbi:hypothetical protein L873DRAFT_189023 [Choiromyces venosus 120613-1]|uniref:Uncharacterized protein n=1 Tax=Choiromyces venosus 120613-1 TaxID=1336337 RepID=A0A3N4J2E5_9PEZI|nr:hypothetical protein L873DRAFT_189023 [Choiromyces venosus 120613-1]
MFLGTRYEGICLSLCYPFSYLNIFLVEFFHIFLSFFRCLFYPHLNITLKHK